MAAGAKAKQLKAAGKTVYDFSLGEPDFNTPAHICQAAYQAMLQGQTHYTAASGIVELRSAVARRYAKMGLGVHADQVLITSGAKHAIHNTLASTVGPGDKVIIPAPYWLSYSDIAEMTGAKTVLVNTAEEHGFKMNPTQLRQAITPRSKLLMLNSPGNPTGAVYSREELRALAAVVLDSPLTVVSDEIYEHLLYGDARTAALPRCGPS